MSRADAIAHRTCTVDGLWLKGNWTNYTMCVVNDTNDYDNYDVRHIYAESKDYNLSLSNVPKIMLLCMHAYRCIYVSHCVNTGCLCGCVCVCVCVRAGVCVTTPAHCE